MPLPVSYQARLADDAGRRDGRRTTPGSAASIRIPSNFFAKIAVEPEPFLKIYPEFKLPPEQMKAWLADRQGVDRRHATWRSGSAGRSATAFRSRARSGGPRAAATPGNSTSTASTTRDAGHRQDPLLLPLRLPRREPARSATGLVGWYVVKIDDPSTVARRWRAKFDEMFANSSAETKTTTEKGFVEGFAKQVGDIGAIMIAILVGGAVHDAAGRRPTRWRSRCASGPASWRC